MLVQLLCYCATLFTTICQPSLPFSREGFPNLISWILKVLITSQDVYVWSAARERWHRIFRVWLVFATNCVAFTSSEQEPAMLILIDLENKREQKQRWDRNSSVINNNSSNITNWMLSGVKRADFGEQLHHFYDDNIRFWVCLGQQRRPCRPSSPATICQQGSTCSTNNDNNVLNQSVQWLFRTRNSSLWFWRCSRPELQQRF